MVRKIFMMLICLSILTGSAFASEQDKKIKGSNKKPAESREESVDDVIKRVQNERAAMKIRYQYMNKLRKINNEIQLEYLNLKYNAKKIDIQHQEELNELAYRGRV